MVDLYPYVPDFFNQRQCQCNGLYRRRRRLVIRARAQTYRFGERLRAEV